jgi:hypothetical protein
VKARSKAAAAATSAANALVEQQQVNRKRRVVLWDLKGKKSVFEFCCCFQRFKKPFS